MSEVKKGSEQQKIALVTGASRGIGKAILNHLAKNGYMVCGTATTQSGADKITKDLLASGFKGAGYVLNVADPDSVTALMSELGGLGYKPNVLINNAGITRDQLFMRLSDQHWDEVIQTNLSGVARITRACIRNMIRSRSGRIVSIGSVVGAVGNPGQTNYCAAKAGVIGFSKALAREVASRNITVNVVAPGFIDSDMTQQLTEAQQKSILAQIPCNKMGTADDIANLVGFLVSDLAGYITGETININGGMYMSS